MSDSNNVIAFPSAKRRVPAQNMDEVFEQVEDARREQIEMIVQQSLDYLMFKIIDEGYDVRDDKHMHSFALLEAAFRSLMCETVGIYDPLQDWATENFIEEEDEE